MRRRPHLSFLAALLVLLVAASPATAANDHFYGKQWALPLIGAETAWATGTGAGITIAIVDTGVDLQHEEFRGRLLPGRNFLNTGASVQDDNGHGTHVAGIAAAAANNGVGIAGVAPGARILPVKVLNNKGEGTNASVTGGIRWAADNGAVVINVSIGVEVSTGFVAVPISGTELTNAINYAWNKGAVCVVTAGNSGTPVSSYAQASAIIVGATDRNDRLPGYTNGVTDAMWGMVAPGGSGATQPERVEENIISSYWVAGQSNRYAWAAGTSMAAPHVAGAAAVLRQLGLTKMQAVNRLLDTAKDIGSAEAGAGRLDVAKAVAGLTPATNAGNPGTGGSTSTSTTRPRTSNTTTARNAGSGTTTGTKGSGPASPPGTATGGPVVVDDQSGTSSEPGPGADDPEQTARGPTNEGGSESGGAGGGSDRPLVPLMAATALLGSVIAGLRRARRV